MSEAQLHSVTDLVIQANRAKPRIFAGDRLNDGDILEDFPDEVIILALAGCDPVACIIVSTLEQSLWLSLLAVAPPFQGKGIGEKTIWQAETVAAERGLAELALDAVEGGNLVPYYLGLGFREESRRTMPIGHWGSSVSFELVKMTRPVPTDRL